MGLSPGAWGAPKRGMPTGSEAFLELPIALGFGPATGPTLKTALCQIRTLVGRRINTARWNLKEIKLEVVGSVLHFRKAARRRQIACLHSLLNQVLSLLWLVGLCGMHVLAIFMSFSENSGIVSVLFTMKCFWHWEQNSSQLALFNLHWGRLSSWGCRCRHIPSRWNQWKVKCRRGLNQWLSR